MQSNSIFTRALIFTALFFFSSQLNWAQLLSLETRCLWIVRESMYTKSSIDAALEYAYQTNYNIVFILWELQINYLQPSSLLSDIP